MEIRKAYPTDAYSLVKIHDIVWKDEYYDILPSGVFYQFEQTFEKRVKHLTNQIQENNRIFVAVNDTGEIIGYIFYAKTMNTRDDANVEIRAIHVLPEYQRKGIGSQLLNYTVEEIKKLGYYSLIAYCPFDSCGMFFFNKKGAITKERITKDMEGYPVICDLVQLDFSTKREINMQSDWNNLYLKAQEYLFLLNNKNHEIAVMMTDKKNMYVGLGIKNYVCPVESALTNVYLGQETKVEKILILDRQSRPVLPCGKCRDLLVRSGQAQAEILFDIKTFKTMTMEELNPYHKDEEKV